MHTVWHSHYGLIEGEQWLAVKLHVTHVTSRPLLFPAQASFVLDTGNGRWTFPGNCIITTHPDEQAKLAAYHALPFYLQPGEPAEGLGLFHRPRC